MQELIQGAEAVSLFCRLNIQTRRKLPVRASEMGLLIYLVKTGGEHTPLDAAAFFKVSKPMVAAMVRTLAAGGYLLRAPSETDGRSYILTPTDKAKILVETTYTEYYKTMRQLRDGMGDVAYATLILGLQQANAILEKADQEETGNG